MSEMSAGDRARRCWCGEPLFEDPLTGKLHCLRLHATIDGEAVSEATARLIEAEKEATRRLFRVRSELGFPDEPVSIPTEPRAIEQIRNGIGNLRYRLDYVPDFGDRDSLVNEMRELEALLAAADASAEARADAEAYWIVKAAEDFLGGDGWGD